MIIWIKGVFVIVFKFWIVVIVDVVIVLFFCMFVCLFIIGLIFNKELVVLSFLVFGWVFLGCNEGFFRWSLGLIGG